MSGKPGIAAKDGRARTVVIAACLATAALVLACGGGESPKVPAEKPESAPRSATQALAPVTGEQTEAGVMPEPTARPGTQVIANINGEPVTQEDLDLEIDAIVRRNFGGQLPATLDAQHRSMIEKSAFEQLVLKAQLRGYSSANQLTVAESDVDQQFNDVMARFGTEAQADAVLQHAGLTREELREDVKQGAIMEKAVEHYLASLPEPGTPEIEAFYQENLERFSEPEQVAASHILIRATPEEDAASREEKRAKIESVRQELLAGADFAETARKYSECPSAQRGGDLGTFGRGQMVAEFEEAAFTLEPGAMSEVVESKFGYHIIRVASHEQAKTSPLDEVRPEVVKRLQRKDLTQWFQALIEGATVERL